MTIYVALLRGVNVGGHKKVAAAELRDLATSLKYRNAATLLNSGNIVFEGPAKATTAIERQFEAAAAKTLGLATDFFVRTAAEWHALAKANPLLKEAKDDPSHLLLWVLKEPATPVGLKALQAAIKGRESFRSGKSALYIAFPDGIGLSKLTPAVIDRALGTRGTGRNWNTVLKLCAMMES
ncbi:MAG: DUF1697 domain-containing protein [Proteobacteria bacterium]|nr:DUF1697 domain-containing protein [Pseudomonadota bacterium]